MQKHNSYSLFKKSSTTYFYSSIFFPKEIKNDVFTLYAFVRTVDDFVDHIPQKAKAFYLYKENYQKALKGQHISDTITTEFVKLMQKRSLNPKWVEAFFDSMESDLTKTKYDTMADTEKYIYGSAEVIGLMMASIMQLPKVAYPYAQMLGKAMQYINFIRDIQEDISLGRTYFPNTELKRFNLNSLNSTEVSTKQQSFAAFVKKQVQQYDQWMHVAKQGFTYIPRRYRIPIQTASEMYTWTAKKIVADPEIIFQKKVKPSKYFVVSKILYNTIRL